MKKESWPLDLAAFIEARRGTPFAWGVSDCALFAADAVEAMTGIDYVAKYRGTYSTQRQAAALIKEAGGLPGFVPLMLAEVEPGFAQRGDVVLLDIEGRQSLGVHLGDSVAGQGLEGLVFVSPELVTRAWRTE